MPVPIPAGVQHFAPPLPPQPFGLYSVAPPPLIESRLNTGVYWVPSNCGPSGTWQMNGCPPEEVDPDDHKTGDRPDNDTFASALVWATDQCSLYAIDTTANQQRAAHLLDLHTPLWVERHMAGQLLDRANGLPAVSSLVEAVGALEAAVGTFGVSGVLHAHRSLAAPLSSLEVVVEDGDQLRTRLGNLWSFGGGYDALSPTTLYATGPVTIWLGPVIEHDAVQAETNERQAVAERLTAVGWECPELVFSVTVS